MEKEELFSLGSVSLSLLIRAGKVVMFVLALTDYVSEGIITFGNRLSFFISWMISFLVSLFFLNDSVL